MVSLDSLSDLAFFLFFFTEGKEWPIEQICQLCANFWRWSERSDWQCGKVTFIYYVSTLKGGGLKWQFLLKVKKIYGDSLDSPSVQIQIMGRKGVKAKHCWMLSTNF